MQNVAIFIGKYSIIEDDLENCRMLFLIEIKLTGYVNSFWMLKGESLPRKRVANDQS